jgi:hypothetical protein
LKTNVDYYYTVAIRYAIATEARNGELQYVTQNFHKVSNVVKVRVNELPLTRGGVPPDWISHSSPLDLIPDLKFFVKLIQAYLESMKVQSVGAKNALTMYIKFLEAEIERFNTFQQEIVSRVARLIRLFQLPTVGIYTTVISLPRGGTRAFRDELITRLTDQDDDTAPPFFRNGLTAGLVLMAGAQDPTELDGVKGLLSLLFGGGAEDAISNPFQDAVDSIDRALSTVTTPNLDISMVPNTQPPAPADPAYETFDDSMEGVPADDPSAVPRS